MSNPEKIANTTTTDSTIATPSNVQYVIIHSTVCPTDHDDLWTKAREIVNYINEFRSKRSLHSLPTKAHDFVYNALLYSLVKTLRQFYQEHSEEKRLGILSLYELLKLDKSHTQISLNIPSFDCLQSGEKDPFGKVTFPIDSSFQSEKELAQYYADNLMNVLMKKWIDYGYEPPSIQRQREYLLELRMMIELKVCVIL